MREFVIISLVNVDIQTDIMQLNAKYEFLLLVHLVQVNSLAESKMHRYKRNR